MFSGRLSIQPTWIDFFSQMSVGSGFYRKMKLVSVKKFQKLLIIYLMNFLNDQNFILQLTHYILISISIPSTNLFFQLTHKFNRASIPIPSTNIFLQLTYQFTLMSIPIPSTKVLLMYLMTIPLLLYLTICLYVNQLMYLKTVRKKNTSTQVKKSESKTKNILLCHRV